MPWFFLVALVLLILTGIMIFAWPFVFVGLVIVLAIVAIAMLARRAT